MTTNFFKTRPSEVIVIAEVGNNHEGNFNVACELVKKAADCGVDAVKFQTFKTEYYISPQEPERFNRLKSFELTFEQFEELSKLAHSLGMLFISTPLDMVSAAFLGNVVDCYKVASSDNTFYPLLRHVARSGKPVIVSTGLSDFEQVKETVQYMREQAQQPLSLAMLHCVTSYPVPPEQTSLRAIQYLADNLESDITIGYSDHTIGIEAPLIAVALGARIIEKHFTLDHDYSDFRDHKLSADPAEMTELTARIRRASVMMGKIEKTRQPCEEGLLKAVRRSIAATRALEAGHVIQDEDLMWTRPMDGLEPGNEYLLLGKRLRHSLLLGEKIRLDDVQ